MTTILLLLQRPWIQGSLPYIGMTSAVVSLAVNQILSKMAISSGTNIYIMVVAFYCLFVTIQSSVVTLIAERDLNAWRLETKIGFIAVSFSAIINVAYRQYVTAWCISRRGPLFVSLFKPLMVGVIFMTQVLYFGSLVGALVLIVGFYGVIWGKSKDVKKCKETESSNNLEAPLLHDNFD